MRRIHGLARPLPFPGDGVSYEIDGSTEIWRFFERFSKDPSFVYVPTDVSSLDASFQRFRIQQWSVFLFQGFCKAQSTKSSVKMVGWCLSRQHLKAISRWQNFQRECTMSQGKGIPLGYRYSVN